MGEVFRPRTRKRLSFRIHHLPATQFWLGSVSFRDEQIEDEHRLPAIAFLATGGELRS